MVQFSSYVSPASCNSPLIFSNIWPLYRGLRFRACVLPSSETFFRLILSPKIINFPQKQCTCCCLLGKLRKHIKFCLHDPRNSRHFFKLGAWRTARACFLFLPALKSCHIIYIMPKAAQHYMFRNKAVWETDIVACKSIQFLRVLVFSARETRAEKTRCSYRLFHLESLGKIPKTALSTK